MTVPLFHPRIITARSPAPASGTAIRASEVKKRSSLCAASSAAVLCALGMISG